MFRKTRLVWKLNGVILVILVLVLGTSSYVTSRAYQSDALTSARDVSGVISQTIVQAIRELMMTRDTVGMGELFHRLRSDNPVFQDIRLVSHDGKVVVAGPESDHPNLRPESWPCRGCHTPSKDPADPTAGPLDEVLESDNGGRVVSVVTPIYREEGCGTGGCHTGPGSASVLGMLQTDYSLQRVDDLIASRFFYTALALLASLLLCVGTTWWIVDHLVGKRIRALKEGAERVAGKDFDFRFEDPREDGIAQLTETFDDMVTELAATLSELTNTKEYLQGIVESSADIIITVDPAGLIKTFNTGAEGTLEYGREEVIGKRIEMLFADPKERDVAISRLGNTDHVVNYETHFLTKSGDIRDVILTLSRLRTPGGLPVGTFGISKDVTEEHRLQHELIFKERLAAVGEAVTGIHHTLKNMLGSLKGGSYMVNLGLEEDDRDLIGQGWTMVQEGISHVTDLSSRTLQYVRDWEPELEETSLGALITSVYQSGCDMARDKGIEYRAEVVSQPATILCDPRLIHSAVMDFVVNAFEACEWKDYGADEVPAVILRAYCAGGGKQVVIEVQDNGHGMTDEVKRNIFNPFFSTKKSTGTGMGLALASRIARVHGGAIHVESEICRGSTLRITLPVGALQERKEELNAQESPGH